MCFATPTLMKLAFSPYIDHSDAIGCSRHTEWEATNDNDAVPWFPQSKQLSSLTGFNSNLVMILYIGFAE